LRNEIVRDLDADAKSAATSWFTLAEFGFPLDIRKDELRRPRRIVSRYQIVGIQLFSERFLGTTCRCGNGGVYPRR
jgi:hypothetical protein